MVNKFILDPSLRLYVPLWKLQGNSFMSEDHFGHLCTVSGAIWTPKGRLFDGVDAMITINSLIKLIQPDTKGTFEVWFNPSNVAAAAHTVFEGTVTGDANSWLLFYVDSTGGLVPGCYNDGVEKYLSTGLAGASVLVNKWHHILMIQDGVRVKVMYDGMGFFYYSPAEAVETAWCSTVTTMDEFIIGRHHTSGGYALPFIGTIGEMRYYSRPLTLQEGLYNYNGTKERYDV